MDKDFNYSEYISEKLEEVDTAAIPMREQHKLEIEKYDLYRLEL